MLSTFGFMRTWSDKNNKYLDPKIWNYQPVRKMLLELPVLPQRSFATYYFWNKKERKINFFHDFILRKWFFSQFSSVAQCVWLPVTPWIAARQASLSITNSRSSLRLTSIELVMPSSHLILFCPFLLLPPIPPASGSFPMSQLFAWGGQSIGVSALASVLPKNTQDWFPSEWTGWISLQSKGLSRVFSN